MQVVALREELRRVQSTNASNQQLPSTTQPTSTGIQQLHNTTQFTNASTQQLPSTTQPAALKSNPSAPSDAQRQTKAISPPVKIAHTTEDAAAGSARQESTHSTRQPACEVSPASQQPAAAAADTLQPIGPRPSCSASTQQPLACDQATQGGQVAEECEGSDNSRQLEGVVAMLTAQLQGTCSLAVHVCLLPSYKAREALHVAMASCNAHSSATRYGAACLRRLIHTGQGGHRAFASQRYTHYAPFGRHHKMLLLREVRSG